jgi:uncharacterized hydrophobic protein (TIGR00271 family)
MSIFGKSEAQDDFIDNIEKEFTIRASYVLLLGFSAVIATLGLLTNSASVIIGSMLISPLFWPVLGISLSIVFSDKRLIRKAIYSFGVSILSVLVVSFLLTRLVPISDPSAEIMVRTNPTLMDLFIALAVSVIGVLAIRYKGISQTATGVAISIALLPVLCVVGIGAGFGSWDILKGSVLLFLANAGAIVFVGATLMYFMGIRPKDMEEKKGFKKKYLISFTLLILLAIPLTYHLHVSIKQEKLKKQITNTLEEKMNNIVEGASVRDINILFPPSFSKEKIKVSAIVFLPQNVDIANSEQQTLIESLANTTNDSIDLELSMFNMLSVKQDDDAKQEKLRAEINKIIHREINNIDKNIVINSVYTVFPESQEDDIDISAKVQQIGDKVPLTFDQKQNINKIVEDELNVKTNLTIEFMPATILEEESDDKKLQQKIDNLLEQDIATLSQEGSLISSEISVIEQNNEIQQENSKDDELDKNDDENESEGEGEGQKVVKITAVIFVPDDVVVTSEYKKQVTKHLEEEIDKKINFVLQVVNFTNIE